MQTKIDQYTTIELQEYRGTYQLVEGWTTKDGDFKPNFCKREMGKKGEKVEKTLPVNVKLGDKATTIRLCQDIILELTGSEPSPASKAKDDSDIPF